MAMDHVESLIHSYGGFELVVDRLVSCHGFLLARRLNSLIIVPLDVEICTLHLIYLSFNDCVSLMWEVGYNSVVSNM